MKAYPKRFSAILTFFCFFSLIIFSSVFAEEPASDIAVLRKEIDSLRQEAQQYRGLNSKLEAWIEQLENKINSIQTQPPKAAQGSQLEERIITREESK